MSALATKKRKTSMRGNATGQRSLLWGLIFVSPWIIGFLLFTIYPSRVVLFPQLYPLRLVEPAKSG